MSKTSILKTFLVIPAICLTTASCNRPIPTVLHVAEMSLYAAAKKHLEHFEETSTDENARITLVKVRGLLGIFRDWRNGESTDRQFAVDSLHAAFELLEDLRHDRTE